MLGKIKENAAKVKEERQKTKARKEQERLEYEARKTKREQERLAKEEAKLKAEKVRLLELSDKEIMVELVFAIRGFQERLSDVETVQVDLESKLEQIENDILDL